MTAPLPAATVHVGQHVLLRPLSADKDVENMFRGSHGSPEKERIWDYIPEGPFACPEKMLAYLQGLLKRPDTWAFAVVSQMSGRVVGQILAMHTPDHRRAELGAIWYAPEAQRGFTNTETVFLLLCHLFETLSCRRVEWKCDNRNERSRSAALRLGFVYEGLFRQHMVVKGQNRDTAWFAMLDRDWPVQKTRFIQYFESGGAIPMGQPTV